VQEGIGWQTFNMLESGTELDTLIHEKVFGHKVGPKDLRRLSSITTDTRSRAISLAALEAVK